MLKLVSLEYKRMPLWRYIRTALLCTLGFTAFAIFIANLEPLAQSRQSDSFALFSGLLCVSFGILASILLSRSIVEEYQGKLAILLFSYPIPRKKLFFAKLLAGFFFILLLYALLQALGVSVMIALNHHFKWITQPLSGDFIKHFLSASLFGGIIAYSMGLISLFAGYLKKSTPTAIVISVVQFIFYSNPLSESFYRKPGNLAIYALGLLLIGSVPMFFLAKKIDTKEI